jgi:hypothetical protein
LHYIAENDNAASLGQLRPELFKVIGCEIAYQSVATELADYSLASCVIFLPGSRSYFSGIALVLLGG